MHPPPPGAAMDFSQNSLFGYMEDLQELTIIERPVRRSLKTPEEIERLTVDEDLSDTERAVYLLSFLKANVVSISERIYENTSETEIF
nr:serine/threonine-protein phosphatase 4 regulatory subunit 4-like [Equus asinus]